MKRHDPFEFTPAPPPNLPSKVEWPLPEIAPGFRKITGKRSPNSGTKYEVQFRCGYVDHKHTYEAHQLRWTHDGSDWDVIAVRKA